MRSSIIKVVFTLLYVFAVRVSAAGLAEHEATCAEIGFKKKTQAYGECVLELDQRANAARTQVIKQPQQTTQAQQNGDGTKEHQTCAQFGFVVGTSPYSDCRLKIDIAKREQAQRQATFDAEQSRYQEEQRRYDQQVAEYQREKERQKGLALLRFSAALAGGTSPNAIENFGNAGRQALGIAPTPPTRPTIQNFTITTPGGRMTNCSAIGNNINCF